MDNTNSLKDRLINQGGSPLSKANGGQPQLILEQQNNQDYMLMM